MSELKTDSIAETLLANGCTERQMHAVKSLLDAWEKELVSLHLQIVGMRAMSHCNPDPESFARYGDTVLWASNGLLQALRQQRDSVAGLVGERKELEQ